MVLAYVVAQNIPVVGRINDNTEGKGAVSFAYPWVFMPVISFSLPGPGDTGSIEIKRIYREKEKKIACQPRTKTGSAHLAAELRRLPWARGPC